MNEAWKTGKRVRLDSLKRGQMFIAIDGEIWTYVRVDGALSGLHHVENDRGKRTSFAASALVVRLDAGRTDGTAP